MSSSLFTPTSSNRALLVLLFVLLVAVAAGDSDVPEYDVCVLGAGAGGMMSAVWLKERGYSVLVLEQANKLAGHCETVTFDQPDQLKPFWLDLGVQVFPNITALQEYQAAGMTFGLPIGPWHVNPMEILNKYGMGALPLNVPISSFYSSLPAYAFDLSRTYNAATNPLYGPFTAPPSDPNAPPAPAFIRLLQIIGSYPWLDSGDVPDPVPAELLRPFSDFITANDLSSITQTFDSLFGGSLGDYSRLTTLYALRNLAPTIFLLGILPKAFLFPTGGCYAMYNGFRAAVGSDNVKLNAYTTWSRRPPGPASGSNARTLLGGVIRDPTTNAIVSDYAYECGKVIVAFPQLSSAMQFLNLDSKENKVFSKVERRYYYATAVKLTKDQARPNPFLLQSPVRPGTILINHANLSPSAPANVWLSANDPIDKPTMVNKLQSNMDNLVSTGLVTSYEIQSVNEHVYQPHPTDSALADRFFPRLEKLQGYRNTYYVGALTSFAAHHCIWEKAYRIINQHFPPRSDHDDDEGDGQGNDGGNNNNDASSTVSSGSSNALAVGGLVAACALAVGLLALSAVVLRRRQLRHAASIDMANMPTESAVDAEGNRLTLAEIAARHA